MAKRLAGAAAAVKSFDWVTARHDVASGIVTAIATIAASVGYALLIFSGPLSDHIAFAITFGLVSAAVTSIVYVFLGSFPFGIAGPDSRPTSVLAAFGAALAASATMLPADQRAATVLGGMILTTLICGVVLYVMGLLKLGRWIRYVPYPIVGGFLAASGWLLIFGALRMTSGATNVRDLLQGVVAALMGSPGETAINAGPLAATLAAGFVFYVITRFFKGAAAIPATIAFLCIAILVGLRFLGIDWDDARVGGWLLSVGESHAWTPAWDTSIWDSLAWHSLLAAAPEIAIVASVTAITIMLSTSAVELVCRNDADADQELRANGVANLAAGAFGGMIGVLSLSRTLLNFAGGGRGRLAGITVGVVCGAALLFGASALSYVAVPVLAGLVLRLGIGLVNDWMIATARRLGPVDYLQLLIIVAIILRYGFLEGVGVGLLIACVTFAVNFSRIPLVRLNLSRADYASNVERPAGAARELALTGDAIQIFLLHGFIFFGSAINLYIDVKKRIDAHPGRVRMVVLYFKSVLGIDFSAEASFQKLLQLAEHEDIILAFAAMPPQVRVLLSKTGILDDTRRCRIFETLDHAIEECEDEFLSSSETSEAEVLDADKWLAQMIGGDDHLARFKPYLVGLEISAGDYLFNQGSGADSLFIVRTGRVSVLYEQEGLPDLRLRSMLGRTIVGEVGLYRGVTRGASVMADEDTLVYRLDRAALERLHTEEPEVALAFHMFIVRLTAERLDFANREVAALSR